MINYVDILFFEKGMYLWKQRQKLTKQSQKGQDDSYDSGLHYLNIQKYLNTEVEIKEPFIQSLYSVAFVNYESNTKTDSILYYTSVSKTETLKQSQDQDQYSVLHKGVIFRFSLRQFWDYSSKVASVSIMPIPVVEFSRQGYNIRKVFGKKSTVVK